MRRLLFWVIGLPLAVVLVGFAMANRHTVDVSFDPLRPGDPWMALSVPLWTVLFFGIFCGLIAGWIGAWLNQRKWRQAARGARSELAATRSEADRLRREQARLAAPGGP